MVHTRVQWEVSMAADKPCPQLQPSLLSTRIEVFRSLIGKIEIKLTCFRDLLTFRIPTYIWTFSLRKLNFFTTLLLDFIKIDQDLENHYLNLPTLKTLIRAKFFLLFLKKSSFFLKSSVCTIFTLWKQGPFHQNFPSLEPPRLFDFGNFSYLYVKELHAYWRIQSI